MCGKKNDLLVGQIWGRVSFLKKCFTLIVFLPLFDADIEIKSR